MIFCKAGLISLDICLPDAFDFFPLGRFLQHQEECLNGQQSRNVSKSDQSQQQSYTPSSLILSFWEFNAVMMETFLNSLSDSFGWSGRLPAIRLFKNLISSGVQVAYLIFSRAVLSLASSAVCVLWSHILSKYYNSGHLMPECLSNCSPLTLNSHMWHQLCAHSTTVKRWSKYRWQLSKVSWEYHIYSTIWQIKLI